MGLSHLILARCTARCRRSRRGWIWKCPTANIGAAPLKQAVQSGQVTEAQLDEKLVRRFRTMMKLGAWEDRPARPGIAPENATMARKLSAQGMVLLKNDGGLLPLKASAIKSLVVIGPAHFPPTP